jgi:putative FmdB family regulatory protein
MPGIWHLNTPYLLRRDYHGMPTYEYMCKNCGKFEEIQRMSDEPLSQCPKCGGHVRRLISKNVGIIFKGPGFYITDNRSEEYKQSRRDAGGGTNGTGGLDATGS